MKLLSLFAVFCFFSLSTAAQTPLDTVLHPIDGVIDIPDDPTTVFFQQAEKVSNSAKTMLVTKAKKTISLAGFLKTGDMQYSDNALADLDNDGKKELLISNFTGGAHCCDEIYIFRNIASNKYQYVTRLFAGNTVITSEKQFVYNFHELLGYFFTCFACGYSDTSDAAAVPMQTITLKYSKGKMLIVPGDKELRSTINDNLGKLGELPYEKLDGELAQDNGLRKEIALNLAVFYYSFGKNLLETQKLFYKYYKHPDAQKVWAAFSKQIQYLRKENEF